MILDTPRRMPVAAAALVALGFAPLTTWAQDAPAAARPASAAASSAAPAHAPGAEGQLQTITVTAERHTSTVQKTSISMEVVSGDEIAEQGLSSGADILKSVSNVEVQGAARGSVIAIRGVGSDMPPGMGESPVSTNYDGVYNFRAEALTLGFYDLDRVEVLRGPQGTLYGRNAATGAVNFISRDPVIGKTDGQTSLEVGSYNLTRTEFGANATLNDMLALRISGALMNRDGYLSDGYDDAKASSERVKLLFKPGPGLRVLAGLEQFHLGGKGIGFVPDAAWDHTAGSLHAATDTANPGFETVGYQKYDATKAWAQVDVDVGIGQLSMIPAYQRAYGEIYRKYDASHQGAENWSYDPDPVRQKSLEARLSSNPGSALQWVVGAYGYDMLSIQTCFLNCRTAEVLDTTRSKALFGQATYALRPGLRLIGGLRHTDDKKTNLARPDGHKWSNIDEKLGVEYDLDPSAMAYATYATAYRPGGFNTFSTDNASFGAEHLRSFELGLKSRTADNLLQFNAALFQMNYKGYQAIDNYLVDSNLVSEVLNVPHQTIRGLESEAIALLPTSTRLRASVTWLDAKLGDLVLHDFATGDASSMAGSPLPHAPRLTIKGGVEQPIEAFGGAVTLRADARYTAKQYISISEAADSLQPGYTQLDLSAQYRPDSDKWGINLYVKNVTNYVQKTGEFGGYLSVGAPRTYGAVLTTRF